MRELRCSPSVLLKEVVQAISGSREEQARIRQLAPSLSLPSSFAPCPRLSCVCLCVCVSECLGVAKPDIRSTSVKAQVMDDYTELDPRTWDTIAKEAPSEANPLLGTSQSGLATGVASAAGQHSFWHTGRRCFWKGFIFFPINLLKTCQSESSLLPATFQ